MNKVVFACVHNAGRSQMAEAYFNALCDPDKAQAVSVGSQPGERVHPEVVRAMLEVGIDLSRSRPKALTPEAIAGASLLVTMGCGDLCPLVPGLQRDDWPLQDPKGKDDATVRSIRDEIRSRVEGLLASRGWGA